MKRVLLLPFVVLACTDLPQLDEGTCGNFVIDRGEDCDSNADDCDDSCRLLCIAEAGTALDACSVPGYTCGIDGFCHAPSGVFGTTTGTLALNASTFDVTDIDKDGFGDIVALSGTSVEVNHGDAVGRLDKRSSTLTPYMRGPAAFLELDDDPSLDIVVPTNDGLVAFSSAFGVVAPHPFSIDLASGPVCDIGKPFYGFSLGDKYMGVLFADTTGGAYTFRIGFAILDVDAGNACPIADPIILCTGAGQPSKSQVDKYEMSKSGVTTRLISIVTNRLTSTPPLLGGLCAAEVRETATPGVFSVNRITPTSRWEVQGRPILADHDGALDGTDCPSLVESNAVSNELTHYQGVSTAAGCDFAPTAATIAVHPDVIGQDAVGRVRLADRNLDALVLTSGVYAVDVPNQAITLADQLYGSDRPLSAAGQGDFDADGDIDLVAIGPQTDDVDVLYRAPAAGPTTFLRYRIDTAGPVAGTHVGDFDGNQVEDIVFAERSQLGQRLKISYGTRDRVLDPLEVGAFNEIVGMISVQARNTTDPFQVVDDLVVLDLPQGVVADPDDQLGELPVYTLFHGSPQRTLLSFFDPRPPGTLNVAATDSSFVAVAARNGTPRPQGHVTDVLAIEVANSSTQLWSLVNAGRGGFMQSQPVGGVNECEGGTNKQQEQQPAQFCTGTARYLRWPLADRDVVIAVNAGWEFRTLVLDPARPGAEVTMVAALDDTIKQRSLAVRSLHAINVDGDPELELVASFGQRRGNEIADMLDDGTIGYTLVCEVDANGRPQSCTDLVDLVPELVGWACVDSAPGGIAPRGRLDLPVGSATTFAVLCHRRDAMYGGKEGQLFRLEHASGAYVLRTLWSRFDAGFIERIKLADVTGDGIDDLLATLASPNERSEYVLVIPQCAASDIECIDGPIVGALPVPEEGMRE